MAARQSPVTVGSRLPGPRTSTITPSRSSIPRVTSVARRSSPLVSRLSLVGTRTSTRLPTSGATRTRTPTSTGAVRKTTTSTTRTNVTVSTRISSVAITVSSTSTRRPTGRSQQDSSTSASIPPATNTLSPSGIIKESSKNEIVTRRRSARLQALSAAGQHMSMGPEINVVYCPICFESIKKLGRRIMATACGHVFCNECLSAAAAAVTGNLSCPICQQTVEFKNLREIFV
ncbi:salivary glue protein Sgs-3-like [Homalodisca vitripennis]|uniref:salivary glue protein Sgs-3-like n=1 Tax=Homalodisca vitripennis TaxID=197043 RepID=UPI001EEAAFB3|nr:salivary glue protein Sgs-3-like [Homalodisca vitripennis]KAG8301095.1 E3 ubiquitin-protein ligase rnf4 [Homalodisca vitripennis]